MPPFTVTRGAIRCNDRLYTQGDAIWLSLRDADSVMEQLGQPKPYKGDHQTNRIRRIPSDFESLWKASVSRMELIPHFWLRRMMVSQMGFEMQKIRKLKHSKLIDLIAKRRGWRWFTVR